MYLLLENLSSVFFFCPPTPFQYARYSPPTFTLFIASLFSQFIQRSQNSLTFELMCQVHWNESRSSKPTITLSLLPDERGPTPPKRLSKPILEFLTSPADSLALIFLVNKKKKVVFSSTPLQLQLVITWYILGFPLHFPPTRYYIWLTCAKAWDMQIRVFPLCLATSRPQKNWAYIYIYNEYICEVILILNWKIEI